MKFIKLFESFNTNKIIFLDIDGCINLMHRDYGHDEYGQIFSEKCVNNLKYILDKTGAKIVISSTWRDSGLLIMKEMWDKRNLPGEVIDITPSEIDVVEAGYEKYYDLVSRGQEIQLWIDRNEFKGKYIIIDDVRDFTQEQQPYFVKTNSMIGISEVESQKAIQLLNN